MVIVGTVRKRVKKSGLGVGQRPVSSGQETHTVAVHSWHE